MNRLLAASIANQRRLEADIRAEDTEVMADDQLLNIVGCAIPGAAGQLLDDELCALLLAWRHDVEKPVVIRGHRP